MATTVPGWSEVPFSGPWIERFLNVAEASGDVLDASEKGGITLREYVERRRSDPAFDAACVLLDRAIELKVVRAIRAQALAGHVPSASLYFKTIRPLLFPPDDDPSPAFHDSAPIPPFVPAIDAPPIVIPPPRVRDASGMVIAAPERPEPRPSPAQPPADATASTANSLRKTNPPGRRPRLPGKSSRAADRVYRVNLAAT